MAVNEIIDQVLHGTYRIRRKIGSGGMATVFEASHVTLTKKRFAIKILHQHVSDIADVYERFLREANITAELGHPNIVSVTDYQKTDDGQPYIVMEYLEGEDLGTYLKRAGQLPAGELVQIVRKVGSALQAAHDKGIVHRDIKPANIFLAQSQGAPTVKVLDFGISKILHSNSIITTGFLGTPQYMSPEQAEGAVDIDQTTDIFALGIICYQALSGILPFDGPTLPSIIRAVCDKPHRPVTEHRPQLGESVDRVLDRALEKNKVLRYQRVTELVDDLDLALAAVRQSMAPKTVELDTSAPQIVTAEPEPERVTVVGQNAGAADPTQPTLQGEQRQPTGTWHPGARSPAPAPEPWPAPAAEPAPIPEARSAPGPAPLATHPHTDLVGVDQLELESASPAALRDDVPSYHVLDTSSRQEALTSPGPSASRAVLWAVISGVAVLAIAGLIWFFAVKPGSPRLVPREGVPREAEKSGTTLAGIHQALKAEQWQQALDHCARLPGPARQQAKASCDTAGAEKQARVSFEKFNQAATRNQRLEALRAYSQIPAASVYRKRAPVRHRLIRTRYLAWAKGELEQAITKNDCARAQQLAEQIREIDARDTTASARAKSCKPPASRVPVVKHPMDRRGVGPTAQQQADEWTGKAQKSYTQGKYSAAVGQARQALKLAPGNELAIRIIGASSCALKKPANARRAYLRLPPGQREQLKLVCQRYGIALDRDRKGVRPANKKSARVIKKPSPKEGPSIDELQRAKALIKKAGDMYVKQNYHAAIKLSRQALKYVPGNSMAIQIIGVSSCYLKKASGIKWAYKRLSPKKLQLLRRVCARNGLQLDSSGNMRSLAP